MLHFPQIVVDFLVSGTATGFVGGYASGFFSKQLKVEGVKFWHFLCAVGHHFHIKQTAMDDGALRAIAAARPAINKALDDAENGLRVERATAAAMEADTTVQTGSLMPKPVAAEALPAPVVAVAVTPPAAPGAPVVAAVAVAP